MVGSSVHASPEDPDVTAAADALGVPVDSLSTISREPLGVGSVVGYTVDGNPGAVAYLDTSLLSVPAETGLVQEDVARLWMHPADPHLPALAPSAYGHSLAILLSRLGITAEGDPALVAYRPGRRAVLRVPSDGDAIWVKVVRPRRVERIVALHRTLGAAGLPVPGVRGWAPDGLVVLDPADGAAALEIVAGRGAPEAAVLDSVDRIRAALSRAPLTGAARASIVARTGWYAARLRATLPAAREDVATVVGALAQHPAPVRTDVGIHGDLHLGQLFLAGDGGVTGLIDVDTAGLGDPADDVGALVGHAVASAALTAPLRDASALWAFAEAAWQRWRHEPGSAAAASVHLLGHALAAADAGDGHRARGLMRVARRILDHDGEPEHKDALMGAFESA